MGSRIEDILSATISGESYNKPTESRIEDLLINLNEHIDGKVDKVSGKGLSTNDFTTAEKTKLDDLAEIKSIGTGLALDSSTGELVATGGSGGGGTLDYTELINKPQINSVLLSGNKSLSDLGITHESKTAASGGTTLSLVTTGEKYAWNNKQSAIDDLSTIRSGAALGATAVQPVTGKDLSTNDYTDTEKSKLAGIAEGAEVNEIEGIKVNNTTINPDTNKVVNITVPTTAADVSALPASTKYAAALSLTINSSTFVMTGQLKDQNGDNLGTSQTIDLPLESVVVGGSYDSQTKKVVLTLQNGNTVEFSVADLVSGLQIELSASNKLNPAYIDYDSTHRAVSDTEKSTWNDKQSALTTEQLAAVNSGIDSTKVEQIETNKNNISSVQEQANWNSNSGVKNKLNYTGFNSGDSGGTNPYATRNVTYKKNADDTISVYTTNAGANGNAFCFLCDNNGAVNLKQYFDGKHILSCDVYSANHYVLFYKIDNETSVAVNGETLLPNRNNITNAYIILQVYNGEIIPESTPIVFNPMIRLSSISDSTYQPHALSNSELTTLSAEDRAALVELVDSGAKNRVPLSFTATSADFTVGYLNNKLIINGSSVSAQSLYSDVYLDVGTYMLTGCPTGGGQDNYQCELRTSTQGSMAVVDTGNGKQFTITAAGNYRYNVRIAGGYTATNLEISPMICTKAAWDISQTYQPYRPSYQELYDTVKDMQTQLTNS